MKEYISHKKVLAAKITNFEVVTSDGHCQVVTDDGASEQYDKKIYTRYEPVAGDYLVEYEDGYKAFSPKEAFESGYELV